MYLRAVLVFILGLIILPVFGWCYFRFGYAPVATASSPMPLEKQLAHMASNQRINKEAPKNSPIQPNDANYEAGAHVYRENCAICYGSPGQSRQPTSNVMYPQPPALVKGHGVTDD